MSLEAKSNIPRLSFVLPAEGGGGGANSIVQEAIELHRMGVTVAICVDTPNYKKFISNYPELGNADLKVERYAMLEELAKVLVDYDIAVATKNSSVFELEAARKLMATGTAPAVSYYVQDYEPLFYKPATEAWARARASYTHVADAVLFAKTKWLQDVVYQNHGVRVHKVLPSIDHSIFFPDLGRSTRLNILAMVRPRTARRAPRRTARILNGIVEQFDGAVDVTIFGSHAADLVERGYELCPEIRNKGLLKRHEVPDVIRSAQLFLDLSDYQAFGRTGLECMACGCTPVLPSFGGADEYARHGFNAFVVDTRSDKAIMEAVRTYEAMTQSERGQMRQNALETAARYSVRSAALSELRIFSNIKSRTEMKSS